MEALANTFPMLCLPYPDLSLSLSLSPSPEEKEEGKGKRETELSLFLSLTPSRRSSVVERWVRKIESSIPALDHLD